MATKKVTVAWLAQHGIDGKKHAEEFYDSPIVRHVDYWTHSDKACIVFKDDADEKFWLLEVEHHPEDWSGTNALKEWSDRPDHAFEVTEVVLKQVPTWVPV